MSSLQWAAGVLGLPWREADVAFAGVAIDSRKVQAGELFIALPGEHVDGHDYVEAAAQAGAAAALVQHRQPVDFPQLQVPDVLTALQRIAAAWRQHWGGKMVAVTGSSGKTSVKEMLAAILGQSRRVTVTQGNLNNHIGVPMSLMAIQPDTEAAVIEMGANHPGEIARLAEIARPNVGVITMAGDAHLEGFGSRDGVATSKAELYQALTADGTAIINADDAYAGLWAQIAAHCQIQRFGFSAQADVQAQDVVVASTGSQFNLLAKGESRAVSLSLPGRHNISNALAATAGALAMGASLDEVQTALQGLQAVGGRLSAVQLSNGATVLDDSYNANLASLQAGLDVLAKSQGARILVFGDMAELGDEAEQAHVQVAELAKAAQVQALYAVGELSQLAVQAFGAGAQHFSTQAGLLDALCQQLPSEATVLVKGSRSAAMDRVVVALQERV